MSEKTINIYLILTQQQTEHILIFRIKWKKTSTWRNSECRLWSTA